MGCVIAEIFTHGQELFDLSSLLRYRSEDVDLSPILNRISDEKIRVWSTETHVIFLGARERDDQQERQGAKLRRAVDNEWTDRSVDI